MSEYESESESEREMEGGRVSTSCPELYVGNNFWHGPIRRKSLHSSPSLCCSQGTFRMGRRQEGNANATFISSFIFIIIYAHDFLDTGQAWSNAETAPSTEKSTLTALTPPITRLIRKRT